MRLLSDEASCPIGDEGEAEAEPASSEVQIGESLLLLELPGPSRSPGPALPWSGNPALVLRSAAPMGTNEEGLCSLRCRRPRPGPRAVVSQALGGEEPGAGAAVEDEAGQAGLGGDGLPQADLWGQRGYTRR